MKQYLLCVYQPDGPAPANIDAILDELSALNEEMRAAGAWVFAVGLHEASTATVVRAKEGEVLITDGPFAEGTEHIGGFTVIQAADLDEALDWAGRLAAVLNLPIEVRPVASG
ncbi:YciI family protein [Nocardia canadensis]|uniref:YciI family protein n=1 Tax=Nocardia canadensis TaxID=3065238 RepID=UPI00292FE265|nr:YciI family protein [Nocardia canadensis]